MDEKLGQTQRKTQTKTEKVKITYTPEAADDLERLQAFLLGKNKNAARDAIELILETILAIKQFPLRGMVVGRNQDIRDIFGKFGSGGYVVRYMITANDIIILRIWHTKEDRF